MMEYAQAGFCTLTYTRIVRVKRGNRIADLICLALEDKASRPGMPAEELGPTADLAPYASRPADFSVSPRPSSKDELSGLRYRMIGKDDLCLLFTGPTPFITTVRCATLQRRNPLLLE